MPTIISPYTTPDPSPFNVTTTSLEEPENVTSSVEKPPKKPVPPQCPPGYLYNSLSKTCKGF